MKKSILLIIILLSVIISNSQKWDQFYGEPDRNDISDDIIELYDNGYYIIAGYEGNGWNIKTDINGNSLYDKLLFHNLYIHRNFGGAVSDDNGNIYVCGAILLDDSWPIVTKYNSCGEKVWCRVYVSDSFNDGVGWDIVINENGDVIVLVAHNSDDDIDQILLYCLSNDGDLLWTKPYASKNDHPEIAVAIGYNLYHYNNSYFIDGYCYWPYPGNPGQVYLRPLFIKIDSLFNEEWILPFGVSDSIIGEAYYTIPISETEYIGTGAIWHNLPEQVEHTLLMYFNENGEQLAHYEIPNDSIGPDVSQNFIVDIEPINDSLFLASIPVGYDDTWIQYGDFIIDSTGIIQNFAMRPNTDGWSDLIKTSDGNYLIAVEIVEGKSDKDILLYKIDENLESVPFDTNTYVYDSLCPGGIQSGTIDITDCLIWTSVEETPSPGEYYASLKTVHIKAYPNPVKDGNITFEFQNTEYHQNMVLKCFNMFGELVHEERIYRYQGESIVDLNGWSKGIFIGVVYSNGLPVGNCKFVKH